ncbi:hypothetical protein M8818_007607 [Zalaria obscura]|uniref:Uncharacterized protein n=1 Tax=Zalaria obscura TaxID=2024903 RepID=A0ACC3S487_9PEZI
MVGMNNGPSTTPAGPPPTNHTSYSFTPAGAPPASVFGSSLADGNSMFPMSKPAFAPSGHLNSPSLKAPLHTNPFGSFQPVNSKPAQKPFGFNAPTSSPPQAYAQEEDYDQDAEGEVDDQAMDVDTTGRGFSRPSTQASLFGQPAGAMTSPRGFKRSRRGDVMDRSFRSSTNSVLEKRTSAYTGIAKSIAAGIRGPALEEPDELVLKSEQLLADLHQHITRGQHMALEDHVADTVSQIAGLWERSAQKETMPGSIGPKATKSNITKANYLASLLLQLHHPRSIQSGAVQRQSLTGHSKKFSSLATRPATTPVPKALLDWINTYHNPFPEDVEEVLECDPAPSAHERFWDVIYATIVRGKLDTAIELFESAGFDYAESAIEDGYDEPGYRGRQLASVQHVVSQCVQLLRSCPAVTDNDWDTRNTDWALFRNRVRNTLYDLEAYAEGDSADRNGANGDSNVFQRSTNLSMSTASRRAESKVPWTVYENLRAVYGQLQGQREEIMLCCQDWLEASIFMTAWWNGDDEEAPGGSLAASRHSLARAQHTRHVDVSPLTAYRKKLLKAFASVTDQPEDTVFGVNTVDPVQVGLALVCEGNVEGLLEILRKWSAPIGAAVVEIASAGGWLPQARPRSAGIMEGLDQDDLMVLSHGQEQQQGDVRMDDILIGYAELLLGRDEFRSQDGRTVREGWELACRVLSRLDSLDTAQRKLRELLERVELDSAERVDRVLDVCNELGLPGQAQTVSEVKTPLVHS